jgi:DNA-binding CsgD family transcriptional regulator
VRDADQQLTVHCLSLQDEAHLIIAARRLTSASLVGLTLYVAEDQHDDCWADLIEAFGLTQSERDIVQALSGGLTAEGIATKMSISVATVRSHIHRAYAKLGVSSREELFHKIAPFLVRG